MRDVIARFLVGQGIRPGDRVGVCVEPSPQWVEAIFGVWGAGASVLPFYPDHPTPFLQAQISRGKPKLILRKTEFTASFPYDAENVHELDHIADVDARLPLAASDAEACMILRGLSFEPLTLTHAQLCAAADAVLEISNIADDEVTLIRSPASSAWSFIEALIAERRRIPYFIADGGDLRCPGWLGDHMFDNRVTHFMTTPSHLRAVMNAIVNAEHRLQHVRRFVLRGEPLPDDLLRRVRRAAPHARVVELFTHNAVLGWREAGAPTYTTTLKPTLPRGARERLPTGDLGRFMADGRLELGPRHDRKVKIANELADMDLLEQVLAKRFRARCAASFDVRGEMRVAVYVESGDAKAIREQLLAMLPQAYHPTSVIVVPRLDGALPPPPWQTPARAAFEAPRTPTEIALAKIWASVLGQERISRHDNFFEIGGDSLLSLHVVHAAAAQRIALTAKLVIEQQVLHKLAKAVDELR